MNRSLAVLLALASILALPGCRGDTCESVQDQIQALGQEIQNDPHKAMENDTAQKLEKLRKKYQEMKCVG
jgi:hypothetical protein